MKEDKRKDIKMEEDTKQVKNIEKTKRRKRRRTR